MEFQEWMFYCLEWKLNNKRKRQRKTLYYIQEHMIMRHAMRIIIRMIQISVLVCVVSLKTKAIQAVPLMKCCVSLR